MTTELFSPGAARVDLEIMQGSTALPAKPELLDRFFSHFVAFGPEYILETARPLFSSDDLLRLSKRINGVIDRAVKPKRDGEPRDVTSYRARLAEARVKRNQAVWQQRLSVKEEDGTDPRVELALELAAKGEKTSIIAGRTGRSVSWVRKVIRESTAPTDGRASGTSRDAPQQASNAPVSA